MTTPHQHWSHYDEALEMAGFNALHAVIAAGRMPHPGTSEKLLDLAHSVGYGDADNYLTGIAGVAPDEIEADPYRVAQKELYEGYMDGDYWNCIDRSERLLLAACVNDEQCGVIRNVIQGMRDSYKTGRVGREAMEAEPSATPAPGQH